MKLKLTLAAIAATVALGYQAQAGVIQTTTNSSKLNVSIVISTNTPEIDHGSSFKNGLKKTKLSTKDLLDLFAEWDGADRSVEPWKSAQLVIGWDSQWDGDVLVVEKNGTNVLFDANDTTNDFFVVDFFQAFGTETFSGISSDPGSLNAVERGTGSWTLVDNDVFLAPTFLGDDDGDGGIGSATVNFTQTRDGTGAAKAWHASESMNTPDEADQEFENNSEITASGKLDASGHGNGVNQFFLNKLD